MVSRNEQLDKIARAIFSLDEEVMIINIDELKDALKTILEILREDASKRKKD